MLAPATVCLKASASSFRALNPAMAAEIPRPARAVPTGPMDLSMFPKAATPVFPHSDSFWPRPLMHLSYVLMSINFIYVQFLVKNMRIEVIF